MEKNAKCRIIHFKKQDFNGEKQEVMNARELWEVLGSEQEFGNWIKERLSDFVDGQDYTIDKIVNGKNSGRFAPTEYYITLDVAKHLAMLERNERGKKFRRFLLKHEKSYCKKIAKKYVEELVQVFGFEEVAYRLSVYDDLLKIAKENGFTED